MTNAQLENSINHTRGAMAGISALANVSTHGTLVVPSLTNCVAFFRGFCAAVGVDDSGRKPEVRERLIKWAIGVRNRLEGM